MRVTNLHYRGIVLIALTGSLLPNTRSPTGLPNVSGAMPMPPHWRRKVPSGVNCCTR